MRHFADAVFWKHYRDLPKDIQDLADKSFELMKSDPRHRSVRLKKVRGHDELWSARVGLNHRALAAKVDDGLSWFWIGDHAEYERLIG